MAERHETVVRSLLQAFGTGERAAALAYFANGASYRVNAWNEPLVGLDAIGKDFERQAGLWTDFRHDLLTIGSNDNVVFTERIDTVHMMGRDINIHAVGIFEIDEGGKVSNWRDYFDMKEVEAQLTG
jgi:limonene-1,2-epoxide hydrolase